MLSLLCYAEEGEAAQFIPILTANEGPLVLSWPVGVNDSDYQFSEDEAASGGGNSDSDYVFSDEEEEMRWAWVCFGAGG